MPTNPLYVNFKKIHDDFQLLAQKHKQIKSFGMGDTDQMSYWTQLRDKQENTTFESPYFPLLYVIPSTCVNHLQYKTWNFQMIMSDIVDRDLTNQVDVLSDTLQMLQDVVSQFRLSNRPELGCYDAFYDNFPDVTFEPFMEEYSDLTNGWTAQLEITTTTALDRCAAAFQDFTGNTYHAGINYKTIHDDFRLMADHHKQVNSFGFGNFEDLSYWTESRLKTQNTTFESPYFPLLYIIPSEAKLESTGLNSSFMNYEFNVVCMDIIDRDLTNQIDVLSDTNQILDDVVSQFRLSVERNMGCFIQEYYLDEQVVYTPFLEKYSDLCGGWSAVIRLKVMTPLDRCNAAFESFITPITPTPSSTPSITPTLTPTPSPTPSNILTFVVASGTTHEQACGGLSTGITFNIYAQDLGNCDPCSVLGLNCWPCLTTAQQVYLDAGLTIIVPDGYYANNFNGGSNATLYIVGGFPQPAGFMGC